LLLLAASVPAGAQSAPAGVANPAAGIGPASPGASAAPANTITGVPKYRAGRRGKAGTTAPVETAGVSITGKGDHTGTGGGGVSSATLDIPQFRNAFGIRTGTELHVKLKSSINSGEAKNGDMVDGTLAEPVAGLPAGTPVRLTVVAAVAAGKMRSCGELSVQVVSINGEMVLSNVITAEGEEGKKILADDAPTRGTDAVLSPEKTLVLPAA